MSEHEIFAHSNHPHEVHARLSISYEATNRFTLSRPSRDLDLMCTTPPARKKRIPLIWREERLSSTEIGTLNTLSIFFVEYFVQYHVCRFLKYFA